VRRIVAGENETHPLSDSCFPGFLIIILMVRNPDYDRDSGERRYLRPAGELF
jgi:hypothetical protein